jgi:hypothetical protein
MYIYQAFIVTGFSLASQPKFLPVKVAVTRFSVDVNSPSKCRKKSAFLGNAELNKGCELRAVLGLLSRAG